MYQKDFIPIVLKVKFESEKPLPVEKWEKLFSDLLLAYAQGIAKKSDCVIGHIKALAEIDEFSYIKFSCINALAGVKHEFHGEHQNIYKINMVINSLVTNMGVLESRKLLNQSWLLTMNPEENIIMEIADETSESQVEHHHHKENEPCPICEKHHDHEHHIR